MSLHNQVKHETERSDRYIKQERYKFFNHAINGCKKALEVELDEEKLKDLIYNSTIAQCYCDGSEEIWNAVNECAKAIAQNAGELLKDKR